MPGYLLGPVTRDAIESAKGPAIAVLALPALAGVARAQRPARVAHRRPPRRGPACLAPGLLVPRAAGLEDLGVRGAVVPPA